MTDRQLPEPIRLAWRTEPCHWTARRAPARQPIVTTDPALLTWAQWNAAAAARAMLRGATGRHDEQKGGQ